MNVFEDEDLSQEDKKLEKEGWAGHLLRNFSFDSLSFPVLPLDAEEETSYSLTPSLFRPRVRGLV